MIGTVRSIVICATLVCLSLAAGCGRSGTVAKAPEFAASNLGFQCRSFTDTARSKHGYVVFVPHGYRSGIKLPVLLFLNGLGENGDDGIKQISNNFGVQVWEMRHSFPFLAVAPQCRSGGSWSAGSQDTRSALEILDLVIEEFGADPDRVCLTGVSAGGSGVWDVASAYPARFAAIVPICAGGGGDPERLANAGVAVWSFHNDADEAGLVAFNRNIRARLIELGDSPFFTEYGQLGHDAWNRAYRTTAMYAWLLEQSRTKNKAEPRFEYWPSVRLVREWRREGGGEWTVDPEGVVVGRRTMEDGGSKMEDGEPGGVSPPVRAKAGRTTMENGERGGVSPPVGGQEGRTTIEDGGSRMEDRTERDEREVQSTQYGVRSTEHDDGERLGERRGGHRFEENWSPPVGELVETIEFSGKNGTCRGLLASSATGHALEIDADVWLAGNLEVRMGVVDARAAEDEDAAGGPAVPASRNLSDLFVSIVLPDVGAGGLVTGDGRWLARLDPSAQRMLRAGAWNDVRLRLANGRLSVHLNGWAACDAEVHSDTQAAGAYRCALVTPNDGSEGRWRFVRTRVLADEVALGQAGGGGVQSTQQGAQSFSREAQPSATQMRDEQSTEYAVQSTGQEADEQDGQDSGQVGKPILRGIDQILREWEERESQLASGQFEWRVVRRNQSETFGAVSPSEDAAAKDGPSESIRIVFGNRGFRLDGESVPSVGLSQRAGAAVSGSTGAAVDHEQFQAALRSRFSDAGASGSQSLANVPYRVLVDSTCEVHFWEGRPEKGDRHRAGEEPFGDRSSDARSQSPFSYPRAIVLAAGTAQRALGADSPFAVPLYSGIVEAFQMAVRPLGSTADQAAADRFRILPDRPVVDGEPCVVVEQRIGETGDGQTGDGQTRRLWVDPSRGSVVVRCLHTVKDKLDGPQYDVEYDQDETGQWLPRTISVLRMSGRGDPLDAISTVRRSVVYGQSSDSADLFAWAPGPGTWVADDAENKQYFIRADGSRRNIAFSENYAGLTFQDLVAEDAGTKSWFSVNRRRIGSALVATFVKAFIWPGILVTLPMVYLVWKSCRVGYNRMRRRVRLNERG